MPLEAVEEAQQIYAEHYTPVQTQVQVETTRMGNSSKTQKSNILFVVDFHYSVQPYTHFNQQIGQAGLAFILLIRPLFFAVQSTELSIFFNLVQRKLLANWPTKTDQQLIVKLMDCRKKGSFVSSAPTLCTVSSSALNSTVRKSCKTASVQSGPWGTCNFQL